MIETDFVYKLNLPPFKDILISVDILEKFNKQVDNGSKIFYPNPTDIFKKEWLM